MTLLLGQGRSHLHHPGVTSGPGGGGGGWGRHYDPLWGEAGAGQCGDMEQCHWQVETRPKVGKCPLLRKAIS